MAVTLDDILAAPQDPQQLNAHLQNLGLIPQPVAPTPVASMTPPIVPSQVAPMEPPKELTGRDRDLAIGATSQPVIPPMTPPGEVAPPRLDGDGVQGGAAYPMKPFAPPVHEETINLPPSSALDSKLGEGATNSPKPMTPPASTDAAAPDLGTGITAPKDLGGISGVKPMTPPVLSEADKNKLPSSSPGAPVGSTPFFQNQLEKDQWKKDNPWGSANNHPGFLGKLAHAAALAGETAGAIVAPGAVAQIPGTRINNALHMQQDLGNLNASQANDRANENAKSEEALRSAQAGNLTSEATDRDAKAAQPDFVRDQAGNITGWRGKDGLHSMDDPSTPPELQKIADNEQSKPRYETDKVNGNIVKITPGRNGEQDKAEVVYKGTPGTKTETKEVLGDDGHVHQKIFDVTPGSANFGKPIADLGRGKEDKPVSAAGELAKMKAGEEPVIGFDKDGVQRIVPKSQAQAEGFTHIIKSSPKDRADAENNSSQLNEIAVKTRNVLSSSKALDQGVFQRGVIANALSHGTNSTLDQLARASILAMASPQSKEYVQDVVNLRESVLGLPKVMTGGSRVSETQAQALWATLPNAEGDSKYAESQLRKFDQMSDRMWKKVPRVEGNDREKVFDEAGGANKPGADFNPPRPADPGMEWKKNKTTGEYKQFPKQAA